MADKEVLKQSLENIINNIDEFESGDIDWYSSQIDLNMYDDEEAEDYRSTDQYLMTEAFKYPELHPLMRKVVEVITKTNYSVGEVWDEDEEHAGTNAALLFALANKEDVMLYADFIATNDLNHPVYQEEDWPEVFDKWGCCEETLRLLITITCVPGQYFSLDEYWEEFAEYLQQDGKIDELFRQLHLFIQYVLAHNIPCRDTTDMLNEKLPSLLPDEDEETLEHIAQNFNDYPDGPVPPTLEMLKK